MRAAHRGDIRARDKGVHRSPASKRRDAHGGNDVSGSDNECVIVAAVGVWEPSHKEPHSVASDMLAFYGKEILAHR